MGGAEEIRAGTVVKWESQAMPESLLRLSSFLASWGPDLRIDGKIFRWIETNIGLVHFREAFMLPQIQPISTK